MKSQRSLCAILSAIGFLAGSGVAEAKKVKTPPKDPQDSIEVVGHIPAVGGPVTHFLVTKHYSKSYLYVEHEGGKSVTLVDISKVQQPLVLSDVSYPQGGGSENLFAVAGTAALITEGPTAASAVAPTAIPTGAPGTQTVRIMDLSDPAHPNVAREFSGVTAMTRDDQRGLIFVANNDGVWILHQELALDPEMLKEWIRQVSAP